MMYRELFHVRMLLFYFGFSYYNSLSFCHWSFSFPYRPAPYHLRFSYMRYLFFVYLWNREDLRTGGYRELRSNGNPLKNVGEGKKKTKKFYPIFIPLHISIGKQFFDGFGYQISHSTSREVIVRGT